MNINDCKGCYSNNETCNFTHLKGDVEGFNKLFNKIPMCPCTNCVIKMMCNQGCPEYSDFSYSYFYGKKEKKENNS